MRILLGVLESFSNPLAYSLVRNFFPPNQRSTANSIIGSAIYLGSAISSLSILIIDEFGWRISFYVAGAFGAVSGLLTILVVREPSRSQYNN